MIPWLFGRGPYHGRPPAWWPRDEPWPPRSSRYYGDWRRQRFVRRTGWYSFWPIWIVFWLVANNLRRGQWFGPDFPLGGGVALLLVCAVAAGTVAVIIRSVAEPVAEIVSAADRIKRRDYRARIKEPDRGPSWVKDTARAFNAMAEELDVQDQARRHLMADVAHELRTPLSVMQAKIEGIIDGIYPSDNVRLQSLLEDTRMLSRLVDDLRTLSTAESGSLALTREPTDIVSLANDVVSSLSARAEAAAVALSVEVDPAQDIESLNVDPVRIREVLINLVANALRHTPQGGRVTVSVARSSAGVDVCVADNGAGIAAAELPHIFDRFYKAAGSPGSGLGLTIARNLVEAHGGSIRADSRAGAGTTIAFTLPREA
jgi:two-component system, OmpR family, sensor histidine kinase BaeS